ncbi:hypothetical protein [Streptomyces sp. NPDC058434]|uniref:DUF7507 domain-containing protein n=1 Tax=Streptomyces sp. NPDC058434 TaxID=3346498 RepID=UPI00364B7405
MEETVFTGTGQNPRITCPEGSLLPGQSKTCTADYTVTQADVNAGAVANTAVASGTPTGGGPALTATASDTVTAGQDPALALVKTATPAVVTGAGQRVDYRFPVTNTGTRGTAADFRRISTASTAVHCRRIGREVDPAAVPSPLPAGSRCVRARAEGEGDDLGTTGCGGLLWPVAGFPVGAPWGTMVPWTPW